MKSFVLAAGLATLLGSAAFAQTATTAAPVTTGGASNDVIVVLPQAVAGSAPARFLADDLEGEDIYGANNEKIGDIEDFVLRPDGSIEAVVVEVGGFLGIGEKDVLVSWSALQIGVQDNDLRITAPGLTRDILQNAQGVDVDTLVLGRD